MEDKRPFRSSPKSYLHRTRIPPAQKGRLAGYFIYFPGLFLNLLVEIRAGTANPTRLTSLQSRKGSLSLGTGGCGDHSSEVRFGSEGRRMKR